MNDLEIRARENLDQLQANLYPGRGIVMGVDETGLHIVQVYWIMGRQERSRNRILVADEMQNSKRLFTEQIVPDENPDPLTLYDAILEDGRTFVVSNGSQTNDVMMHCRQGRSFFDALSRISYEPDHPTNTPRITAIYSQEPFLRFAQIAIIRPALWGRPERHFYQYDSLPRGYGLCITTYEEDGDPPAPFEGVPRLIPLIGRTPEEVIWFFRQTLRKENLVSLAVKFINMDSRQSSIEIVNSRSKA